MTKFPTFVPIVRRKPAKYKPSACLKFYGARLQAILPFFFQESDLRSGFQIGEVAVQDTVSMEVDF
jgi:hypothetical protein